MAGWIVQADGPVVGFGDNPRLWPRRRSPRRSALRRQQPRAREVQRALASFRDRTSRSCRPIAFPGCDARRCAMRIVGGKFKGRAIRTPEGGNTRPTSDRAREVDFQRACACRMGAVARRRAGDRCVCRIGRAGFRSDVAWGGFLPVCGDGEFGSRAAFGTISKRFSFSASTRIHRRSAIDLGGKPAGLGEPFDLVFLDPPYAYNLVPPALDQLVRGAWITRRGAGGRRDVFG